MIDKLDFGQDSAESEAQTLHYVFLSAPFYRRLRTFKKWLVLGRKGSGKTAACLMLFRQLKNEELVTYLTSRSLSAAKSTILDQTSINSDEASLLKWHYVFLLEASRYIVCAAEEKYGSNYITWPKPVRGIRSFLVNQDTDQANQLDKAMKFVRGINKFAISAFKVEGSIEMSTTSEDVLGDVLDQTFALVQESSELVLNKSLYILVDQVDDLWDSTKTGQDLIIGLLRSAKEVNDRLSFAKVIVFLRSDIFSHLRFHDSDKYRSHTELITWTTSNLKKLIALRIKQSTGIRGNTDSLWEAVFPATVKGKDTLEYLVKHTFMRPRDLIQLCNICRDAASNRDGQGIMAEDIIEAIPQYSDWKLQDLVSEYDVQYPFLERFLLSVFYNYPYSQMKREDFKDLFEGQKPSFVKQYGSVYFEPTDTLLQVLYTIGFLGVFLNGKTLYASLGDKFILPYARLLEIHPAFRKALNVSDREVEQAGIVFDQRGQVVGHQINVAGNISGDVVTGRRDIVVGSLSEE